MAHYVSLFVRMQESICAYCNGNLVFGPGERHTYTVEVGQNKGFPAFGIPPPQDWLAYNDRRYGGRKYSYTSFRESIIPSAQHSSTVLCVLIRDVSDL